MTLILTGYGERRIKVNQEIYDEYYRDRIYDADLKIFSRYSDGRLAEISEPLVYTTMRIMREETDKEVIQCGVEILQNFASTAYRYYKEKDEADWMVKHIADFLKGYGYELQDRKS